MKKYIVFSIAILATMGVSAQRVLVGDTNMNGVLSIEDVTRTTDMLLNPEKQRYVSTQEYFIRENHLTGKYLVDGADKYFNNGYEYVDLGLPSKTLWCATNIGAYIPDQYGTSSNWYFASELLPQGWDLPTEDQLSELVSNCNFVQEELYGESVIRIVNKKDASKYILFANGGSFNNIWSSTAEGDEAWTLRISNSPSPALSSKYISYFLRPVVTSLFTGSDTEIGQGDNNGDLE